MSIALYLECQKVRRSYVQKVPCSENICSEGPMSDGLLFRRSYDWKVLSSQGPVFRRSLFRRCNIVTHFHLSVSGIETFFFISVHFTFLFYFLHNFIIHFFLGYTRMSSEDPMFFEVPQVSRALKSERTPVPMFRSSVVMHMRFALRLFCN